MHINKQANPIATCPHGMPPGACPTCTGMGGGGGGGKRAQRPGEMSYEECYTIGQMMKSAKENALQSKLSFQNSQRMAAMQNRMESAAILQRFQNSALINRVILPVLKSAEQLGQKLGKLITQPLASMAQIADKIQNKIKAMLEKLPNIADKLAAIFGDQENSLKDKISKNFSKLKKKIFSFFEMVDGEMEQGETEEFDEKIPEEMVKLKTDRETHDDTRSKVQ